MGSCPASGSTVAWYHQIPHRRLMLVVYPAMAVAAVLLLVLVVIALRSSREETLPNKTRRQSLKDRVDIQAEVEVLDPPSSSITSPSFLFRQWDTRRCKGPPVDVKLPTWKPVTLPPYVSARWTDWWCGWAHQERLKCSTLRPRWLKTSGKCGAQMKKGWEEWQGPAEGPLWKSSNDFQRVCYYHHLPAHIIILNHIDHRVSAYQTSQLYNSRPSHGLDWVSFGSRFCCPLPWPSLETWCCWSHGAHQEVQNSFGNTPTAPQIILVLFRNSNSRCWLWIHMN